MAGFDRLSGPDGSDVGNVGACGCSLRKLQELVAGQVIC